MEDLEKNEIKEKEMNLEIESPYHKEDNFREK